MVLGQLGCSRCGGVRRGASSLLRLEPTPGSAVGRCVSIPVPGLRVVDDVAHRFAGGLLHVGWGELHVVDNVGNVAILRAPGSE